MAIEIDTSDIQEEVSAILNSLRDIKSLYIKIQEELQDIANISIENQKSATTGRAFNPLTDATQKLTGKAASPALMSRRLGGRVQIRMTKLGGSDAMLTTDLPFAEVHQFGNPNNTLFGHKAPIKARAFLPLKKDGEFTQEFLNKLELITEQWINQKINENV